MTIATYFSDRREYNLDLREVHDLIWAWRGACEGAGLCAQIDTPTGPTVVVPTLVDVTLGPPTVLIAQLMPGQLAEDIRRQAHRLAGHLGAVALRVQRHGLRHVRVELLPADPLDGLLQLELPRLEPGVLLGRGEDGLPIVIDWEQLAHMIVQGVTRSGKSVLTYGLLAQVAGNRQILVAGCDPTALLFRPFTGSRHAEWQVSGTADPARHVQLLERLVAEMDTRIVELPADRDTLAVTEQRPLILVVLEELVGLLRVVDAAKTKTDDPGKRYRALMSRLLAEGAKVGFRVLLLAQRAEATLIGSFERAMCSTCISFRVDKPASIELLHSGVPKELAEVHTTALPGIALISTPGRPLERMRAPYLGGYPEYVAAIATACLPDSDA